MNKGDIVYGKNNTEGGHPIIFLSLHDDHTFLGVMLTKASNHSDNIAMLPEHFETNEHFSFKYNSTHLVGRLFLKRNEWEPFQKVGELTPSGISFVEKTLTDKAPMSWEEYVNSHGN